MKSLKPIISTAVINILFSLSSLSGQLIAIDSAKGGDAIRVIYAQDDGLQINEAVGDGVFVSNAKNYGVNVANAEKDGVYVGNAQFNGVHVDNAGNHGLQVRNAARDGIMVANAGGFSLNILGHKSLDATLNGHIAQISNRALGGSADVLALKVGQWTNPGGASNFITFFSGNDAPLGRIEGNGSGGVLYGTTGADFAECLPLQSADEQIEEGDIVGVYEGHISLRTIDATTVMVITDRPAVLGNQKEGSLSNEKVSFIGQVPVNVIGQVEEGDWIVASGAQDGTAIAVSPLEVTLKHQIVGRAWESNEDEGIKKVMTAVGLDHSEAKDVIIQRMDHKIKAQQESIEAQQASMNLQQVSIDFLQEQINKLTRLIKDD